LRDDPEDTAFWSRRPYLFLVNLVLMGLAAGIIGFVAGALFGEATALEHFSRDKRTKVSTLLEDPRYAGLKADLHASTYVPLSGKVDSEQMKIRLQERLRFLFGDAESRKMIQAVEVKPGAPNESKAMPSPAE
jgi:hypothetical protein